MVKEKSKEFLFAKNNFIKDCSIFNVATALVIYFSLLIVIVYSYLRFCFCPLLLICGDTCSDRQGLGLNRTRIVKLWLNDLNGSIQV